MTDPETLARMAAGDSVTAARLRGGERYYPDCRPFLLDGQHPEHLILLSTSGTAVSSRLDDARNRAHVRTLSATRGGVVVLAQDAMLVVVDDDFLEIPYDRMDGCLGVEGILEIPAGGFRYRFNVAKSADDRDVDAGVRYLRRRLRGDRVTS